MVGVLEQYPHYLYRDTEDGWIYTGRCREETNGKGGHIRTADMEAYTYSSIIQMPPSVPKVPEGVEIIVSNKPIDPNGITQEFIQILYGDSGPLVDEDDRFLVIGCSREDIRIIGICAKFDPGRLHNRMWV